MMVAEAIADFTIFRDYRIGVMKGHEGGPHLDRSPSFLRAEEGDVDPEALLPIFRSGSKRNSR